MKPSTIFLIGTLLLFVAITGCIQTAPSPENTSSPSQDHWTVGFYDKAVYGYPDDVNSSHRMEYVLEWSMDMENSTGFAHAEKRNSSANRVPVFTVDPGTTGKIAVLLSAPKERNLTVFLDPQTDLPDGVTLSLENAPLTIPAGETISADLNVTMSPDVTSNNHSVSLIRLATTHGANTGRWCLILTSSDPYIPPIDEQS